MLCIMFPGIGNIVALLLPTVSIPILYIYYVQSYYKEYIRHHQPNPTYTPYQNNTIVTLHSIINPAPYPTNQLITHHDSKHRIAMHSYRLRSTEYGVQGYQYYVLCSMYFRPPIKRTFVAANCPRGSRIRRA